MTAMLDQPQHHSSTLATPDTQEAADAGGGVRRALSTRLAVTAGRLAGAASRRSGRGRGSTGPGRAAPAA